ncbi:MAG: hypothetical protein UY41_C0035G0005 [Candidatus Moranbacteria bacterium GW2011_GWE1_49_15]|nr:MAG: hypothetical protein UX75_C0053G0006 [Candidatus Moranbacteria bacterium GW2011_GWE2_47_10]KKW06094.1 MAG: hypothetical protein UY41_C0035G0005 [Candidatus Moranbacteria bacterium GW2011_GWE1_49_15]HBP00729.1 hypothetical protein [Candidatus Moranbacteria bacterium]
MERIEQFESKEKYGENVEIIIDLIRHAKKDGFDGPLSPEGEKDSVGFGDSLRQEFPDSDGVKVMHSGIDRAEKTGKLIRGDDESFKLRKRSNLGSVGKISRAYIDALTQKVNERNGDETQIIQEYLEIDFERPDVDTLSSREISADLATQILRIIKMSGRLENNSKVNFVLVSHSGILEHFLVDILKKEREGFLQEIGGTVNFLEGARMAIRRNDKNDVSIVFKFRKFEFKITEQDLENIINAI